MTMLPHSLCGARHIQRVTQVVDARKDPTGTSRLRSRMRAEGDRRWQALARTLRQGLCEHDLVGQRGIGRLPHGDKVEGFAAWLKEELRQKVLGYNGSWLKPYVGDAAAIAQSHATETAPGGDVDPGRVVGMGSLAANELAGICAAALQQITRAVAHCLMANATPTRTANAAAGVIKVMRNRTRAMSEYIIAKTFNTCVLSAYRDAGVEQVGIIPERVTLKQTAHGKVLDAGPEDEPRDPHGRWTTGTNPVSGKPMGVETTAHGYKVEVWPVGGKPSKARMKYRGDPARARMAREAGFVEPKFTWNVQHQSEQHKYTRSTQGGAATESEAKEKALAAAKHLSSIFKDAALADAPEDVTGISLPLSSVEAAVRKRWMGRYRALRRQFKSKAGALKIMGAEIEAERTRLEAAGAEFRARLRAGTEEFVARREAEGAAARSPTGGRRPGPGARVSREKMPSPAVIGAIEKVWERLRKTLGEGEVDVITAGDELVCPECEDISDEGPYSLDEAEGLIPAHPNCRCAFVPAGKYEKDALDFDPDQARDPQGRWTSVGGGGGFEFVSPSVGQAKQLPEAIEGLKGDRQRALHGASKEIDNELHIVGKDADAIGAWSDGAENSMVTTVANNENWDKLKVSAAMKGDLADQKAVLVFKQKEGGTAALYHFPTHESDITKLHENLLADGVAFHTIVPHTGGGEVLVADLDGSAHDAVAKAAERYHARVDYQIGQAEFIGTTKQTGSDREQRDDARRAYAEIIRRSPVPGSQEVWTRVHNHWGQTLGIAGEPLSERAQHYEHLRTMSKQIMQQGPFDAVSEAAGVLFRTPRGHMLLMKRADTGEWSIPAGHLEQNETPLHAAQREAAEETGWPGNHRSSKVHEATTRGVRFHTFVQPSEWQFKPILNPEHTQFGWFSPRNLPAPLHPGLVATLHAMSEGGGPVPR